jgi:hypothetical protein
VADVILDHLGHQTVQGAACGSHSLEYLVATLLLSQCPLDPFDLSSDSANSRHELVSLSNGVHAGATFCRN